jgi:hypothetical protein
MPFGKILKKATKAVSSVFDPISAATGITGGDLFGFGTGLLGSNSAQAASRENAAAANAFTEKQLKNRHQWEVEDLRKAGLNPVLSSKFGGSIGGSAQAQAFNPIDGISKQMQAVQSAKTLKRMDAEIKKLNAETRTQNDLSTMYFTQAQNNVTDNLLKSLQVPYAQNEMNIAKSKYGKAMQHINKLGGAGALATGLTLGTSGKAIYSGLKHLRGHRSLTGGKIGY